jgi:gluconolactonase
MNDLTVDPDGRVIVGLLRFHPFAGEDPVAGEFVRLDGSVVLPGVLWCNGCAFSPDGATFYGCDYERGLVLAVTGEAPPRTVVTSPSGDADGMAVDEDGCLWVALGSRGTVGRFTPDGVLDSEVTVEADFVASVCFFGPDRRDLVITTTGDVFVGRAPVAGVAVPAARE